MGWFPQKERKQYVPPPRKHERWQDYSGDLITEKADAAIADGWSIEVATMLRVLERDLRRRIDEF